VNVAGVANVSVKFFYLGSLIANPPIVAGTTLAPTVTGEIVYRFTQPGQACDSKTCEQEILQIDKNPESCWVYENVSLDNLEQSPKFFFRPVVTDDMVKLRSLGNINGYVFEFRARVTSRCGPTS